jgi:hypothetical protein
VSDEEAENLDLLDFGELPEEHRLPRIRRLLGELPTSCWSWDYGVSLRTSWGLMGPEEYILQWPGPQQILTDDAFNAMEFVQQSPQVVKWLLTQVDYLNHRLQALERQPSTPRRSLHDVDSGGYCSIHERLEE